MKSWTFTGSGAAAGCHSRPFFLNGPAFSFFLASTLMAGSSYVRCGQRRCRRTSNESRSASPMKLMEMTTRMMAMPAG